MFYKKIIRPIFFRFDPERVHIFVIKCMGFFSLIKPLNFLLEKFLFVNDDKLKVKIGNLEFKNPIGLAAGFDKYIDAPLSYPMFGFGFAELGSITYKAQSGNPKPRVWRMPKDESLIIYYGLSNCGAKITKNKIIRKIKKRKIPYGISIAPTTNMPKEKMSDDYVNTFLELYDLADYIVLNISCPNVANLDFISRIDFIEELLQKLYEIRKNKNINIDLFIKIGPELSDDELKKLVDICFEYRITGVIATNLCKKRENLPPNQTEEEILEHPGGVSGKLIKDMSLRTIKKINEYSQGKLKIIGVGGVFTAQDAYDKIKAGANAIQLITGFIYEGPFAIRKINKELLKLLENDSRVL